MFCRIEVLKGEAKTVIYTRYQCGVDWVSIESVANRARREHGGDGFRLRDMHTGELSELAGN